MSVSQLTDRGYDVKFTSTHGEVVCKKTGKVALIGPRLDNMYVVKLHLNTDDGPIKCLLTKASVDESWNWNKEQCYELITDDSTPDKLNTDEVELIPDEVSPTGQVLMTQILTIKKI